MIIRRETFIMGASRAPSLGVELALDGRNRGLCVRTFARSQPDVRITDAGLEHTIWDATKPADLIRSVRRITKLAAGQPMIYVVWNLGIYDVGPLAGMSDAKINRQLETHAGGLLKFLARLHPAMHAVEVPYQLIVIASTSAWKARGGRETAYCASKAAEAAIARQFVPELVRDLPGSKVTLVNPGGMQTRFLGPAVTDFHALMPPDKVAKIIWNNAIAQTRPFEEINILRRPDGKPKTQRGIRTPEAPFPKR